MGTKPLKEQKAGKREYKLGKKQNGGRISHVDRKYIEDNWNKKTVAQLQVAIPHRTITQIEKEVERAKKLAEGDETIQKTVKKTPGRSDTPEDRLRHSHDWPKWNKQFTEEELQQFINRYTEYDAQFHDRTPTEDMQIKSMITNEIMLDRLLIRIKMGHTRIENLTMKIAEIENGDDYNMDDIQLQEARIDTIKADEISLAKQQKDYQDFIEKTLKSLKSTREQRNRVAQDSSKSFSGLIRLLSEKDIQIQIGEEIVMQAIAGELEHRRLSKIIKFEDGEMDRPILNYETDGLEDDEYEQDSQEEGPAEVEGLGQPEDEGVEEEDSEEGWE